MLLGASGSGVDPVVFDASAGELQTVGLALKQRRLIDLEAPFGWKKDIYKDTIIQLFPQNTNPTITFTATLASKIVGYIPLVGTLIGISRIYKGIKERNYFNQIHMHDLSGRSVKWAVRGGIECVPVLGGIICLIIDIVFTISKNSKEVLSFKDETACKCVN